MHQRLFHLIALIAGAMTLAPPVPAAEADRPPDRAPSRAPRSPLAAVPALDKPVTYTETKIPLGELIQKVAADTGVLLTAAPEVADEPVAVVVNDLPARQLLEQLADLLDYMWSRRTPKTEPPTPNPERRTPAFEIWQDLAAKAREEAARQAARAEVERRLGEEVRRFAAVAALPLPQIQSLSQQYQQWREQFFKLPPAQRSAASAKERRRVEEMSVAHQLASPVNRTLALLLGQFTPPQWAALRRNQPVFFSTDPQPGELLLPDETARAFRAAHPSMDDGWGYGDQEFAEKERQKQREMEVEWTAATGYRAVVRLDSAQFQRRGSLTLRAHARPLNAAPARAAAYAQAEGASLQLFADPGDPRSETEDDSPERRAALEKDPLLGSVRRFKRQPKPKPDSPANRSWTSLQDLLPDLGRSCGLNLIADAYNDRTAFPIPSEEPTPVYQLLDRITQYGYRWDRRGDLIRIRNRAWFFARPREVPLRIVRHLGALLKQEGELPLDEAANAVAALNDDQLENLTSLLGRSDAFSVMELHRARHALRLYATFTPLQRQVLWQGQPFPFGAMTPAQRELFLAQWHEEQQPRVQDEPSAAPSETPVPPVGPASRFALTLEHPIVTIEKHGDSTHFTWEPAPSPTAAASRPASGAPAAVSASRAPARPPAASAARRSPPGALRPNPVTRRQLLRVRFQFLYTPELQDGAQLTVAANSAPPPPDRSSPAARDAGDPTP